MNNELPCPPIDSQLIDFLSSQFPNKTPDPNWSDREVWMAVGAQLVVQRLEKEKEDQENNKFNL